MAGLPHGRMPDHSKDPNNNTSTKSYSLRPRSVRRCEEDDSQVEPEAWRPTRSKRKQKSMPLSKYRRKTANARERSRMREINEAFEALRKVIPHMSARECNSEKLTKITTLRLAMKYISALNNVLHDQDVILESDGESLLSDYTMTPPEGPITSPALTDSLTSVDFFSPLLSTDLAPSLPQISETPLVNNLPSAYPETTLQAIDSCMSVTDFGNSSYVFEDTLFLTEFS